MRWILILKMIFEFSNECMKNTKMLTNVNSDGLNLINGQNWQRMEYLNISTENESITLIITNSN